MSDPSARPQRAKRRGPTAPDQTAPARSAPGASPSGRTPSADASGADVSGTSSGAVAPPGPGRWLTTTWSYTLLRIVVFGALWGILWLCGLHGLAGAFVAAILSIPLSFVLLAKPRARLAAQIEARVDAQRVRREKLDAQLEPEPRDDER